MYLYFNFLTQVQRADSERQSAQPFVENLLREASFGRHQVLDLTIGDALLQRKLWRHVFRYNQRQWPASRFAAQSWSFAWRTTDEAGGRVLPGRAARRVDVTAAYPIFFFFQKTPLLNTKATSNSVSCFPKFLSVRVFSSAHPPFPPPPPPKDYPKEYPKTLQDFPARF